MKTKDTLVFLLLLELLDNITKKCQNLKNGDYLGALPFPSVNLPTILSNLVTNKVFVDFGENLEKEFYLYAQDVYGKLKVVKIDRKSKGNPISVVEQIIGN